MSDEKARRMLDEIRLSRQTIERAIKERDRLIRDAAEARISQREIMEAATLGRTRVHEIIHEK